MAEPEQRSMADAATAAPTRVLVAEDNAELRSLLAGLLRHEGYEVFEACDGDELESLVSTRVHGGHRSTLDVIISDVRMPGHSALDTLAAVVRAPGTVPVILITALDDEYTHAEAARLGVAALFHKP